MNSLVIKKEVTSNINDVIKKLETNLQLEGFGVLTRIDFSKKIEEKLKHKIPEVVILGACNPSFAYEAYQKNTAVTAVIPCNVTVSDIGHGRVSVEIAKPSALMNALGNGELVELAASADKKLARVLEGI